MQTERCKMDEGGKAGAEINFEFIFVQQQQRGPKRKSSKIKEKQTANSIKALMWLALMVRDEKRRGLEAKN